MPKIIGVKTKTPRHAYSQEDITELFIKECAPNHGPVVRKLHKSSAVDKRHLTLPLEQYAKLDGFGGRNNIWREVSMSLAKDCVGNLLSESDLPAEDINHIFFTSVTGISAPSIDALLVNSLDMSESIKRTPIFGLGCLAGAALISRATDYLRAYPQEAVLVLAVELCTLTWQKNDETMANFVACGLFGDGAGAVLMVGDHHPKALTSNLKVVDSRQAFFKNTENIMGWEIRDSGFKIILSGGVPDIAREKIPPLVTDMLASQGLGISDVSHWVAHPGGPKVIKAIEEGLGLKNNSLKNTRDSLAETGNLSSVSVLAVLEKTLQDKPKPGDYGVLFAMGPGFCAEMVLLKW